MNDMDFLTRGRGNPPTQPANDMPQAAPQATHQPPPHGRRKHIDWTTRTVRIELFIVLLGCALLLVAVSIFLGFSSSSTNSQADRVDTSKYQAVFLNGGVTSGNVVYSAYFGHITALNDKYFVLQDVYYLTADQTKATAAQNTSQLTKLGCDQLHSPYDQMVINRDQVAFWENIKDDGKVVKAIGEYKKQNPNGPKCTTTTKKQTPATTQTTPATVP